MRFRFSRHALSEMERRGVSVLLVESVLQEPQQVVLAYGQTKAYQSRIEFGEGKVYLVRAIVDETVDPPMVITVYRTSKIGKYWRKE
ncbi:MAG TPA: DUF4258 domain-containing protein [Syntrophobacteria bacterium]|nr:DUF4258 domain-containing protein [Syntrophobacteria bacterium]